MRRNTMHKTILASLIGVVWIASLPGISNACTFTPIADIADEVKYVWIDTQVEFDGSGSVDRDENGQSITDYDWQVPSGVTILSGQGTAYPVMTFSAAGQYIVTLSVKDDEGYWSFVDDRDTCTVYVVDPDNPNTKLYVKSGGAGTESGVDWDNAFATIQRGINEISDIGVIYVWWEDTYQENIDFQGKGIILVSANGADEMVPGATIEGDGTGSVVRFTGDEGDSCRITGFTITGGGFVGLEGSGSGLQAHWKLDESSGNAQDATGNGYTGTLVGGSTWDDDGGRYGGALPLNGSDQYVSTSYNGVLGSNARTTAAWIKTSTSSGLQMIIDWGESNLQTSEAGSGWYMYLDEHGQLYADAWGCAIIANDSDLNDDQWHHVAAVLEDDGTDKTIADVKLYIDGKRINNTSANGDGSAVIDTTSGYSVSLGVHQRWDGLEELMGYFDGCLDEVRIYDRALNEEEIFQLAGPKAYWKLDEQAGTTAKDEMGHFDGTLTYMDGSEWCAGWQDGALAFDGDNDYIAVSNVIDPGAGTFSAFAWVKSEDDASIQVILQQEDGDGDANGRVWLYKTSDNKLASYLGEVDTITANPVFAQGQWHHVGLTYDGTILQLYVNGDFKKSKIVSAESEDAGFRIGGYEIDDLYGWNGLIDEVRIYDRMLDADDVERLYITYRGGGIQGNHAKPVISHCTITDNSAQYGAGIADCDGIITNCLIADNMGMTGIAGGLNSGIAGCRQAKIINCTIANNDGYGLYDCGMDGGEITNCIVWGNTFEQLENCVLPTYSCIQDWGTGGGTGNMDSDPKFVNGANGDYHLQVDSPCINAGDPSGNYASQTDLDGNPRVMNTVVDMGLYEKYIIYVDETASGSNDGTSWTDAYNYLQDALAEAASLGSYKVDICVAASTYLPDRNTVNPTGTGVRTATFQLLNNVAIYGGFPAGGGSWSQRNPGTHETILSGDLAGDDILNMPDADDNCYHIITGADNSILDGFTVTAGCADDNTTHGGAAILCNNASPTICNCTIMCNFAKGDRKGGAVHSCNGSSPTLINCLLCGNLASGNQAGGIYHNGTGGGILSLTNCTIVNNSGDGIHCEDSELSDLDIEVKNCIIWKNRKDPTDTTNYSIREICLIGHVDANISYCNIEGGDTKVIKDLEANLNWDISNISSVPQIVTWGAWDWRKANGDLLEEGVTSVDVKPEEIAIYDLRTNFEHVGHSDTLNDPDNFVLDTLDAYNILQFDGSASEEDKSTLGSAIRKFDLWYNSDPDGGKRGPVNTNIEVPWRCINAGKGIFQLKDEHFFPIDECCVEIDLGNGCSEIDCFGVEGVGCPECDDVCPVCSTSGNDVYHNWFFTLQYHTEYTYVPGMTFYFEASDDIFVAIESESDGNSYVVVERAGYYIQSTSKTTLVFEDGNAMVYNEPSDPYNPTGVPDAVFPLDLKPDKEYGFHLFYALRHTGKSVLIAERTLSGSEIIPVFISGDYHLQSGSPCIDAGDNTVVPSGVEDDPDGYPRKADDPDTPDTGNGTRPIVDMGAYEYQIDPVAQNDSYSIGKNEELVVPAAHGVLANDWPSENLTAVAVSDTYSGETIYLNSDGSFTYSPTLNFTGNAEFTYQAQSEADRLSEIATITIAVNNSVPVAVADLYDGELKAINKGILSVSADKGVLANDYDPDGDDLTAELVSSTNIHADPGGFSFYDDGSFVYDPEDTYVGDATFTYKAEDSSGAYSNVVTVTIKVDDPQSGLVVDAGQNRTITWPEDTLYLNDASIIGDYDPSSVQWSVKSAFATGSVVFDSSNELHPDITLGLNPNIFEFYPEGVIYTLELSAEDYINSTPYSDYIEIMVKPGLQFQAGPNVDAGDGGIITLPEENTFNLTGTVTDDGKPANNLLVAGWSLLPNPNNGPVDIDEYSLVWDEKDGEYKIDTTATFSRAGNYLFKLWASDGEEIAEDTVLVTVNTGITGNPSIDAGENQTIQSLYLDWTKVGTANQPTQTDCEGLTLKWEMLDGPELGKAYFDQSIIAVETGDSADKAISNVTFTQPGDYVLQLSVEEMPAIKDEVVISIEISAGDIDPPTVYTVNAGPDQWVKLSDAANVQLAGSIDPVPDAGSDIAYLWTDAADGTSTRFSDKNVLTPTADCGATGEYVLQLTAFEDSNENGAIDTGEEILSIDQVTIFVWQDTGSIDYVVDAGPDQQVVLPNYARLAGTVSIDGTLYHTKDDLPTDPLVTAEWTKISGDGPVDFADEYDIFTPVYFAVPGEYELTLTVSENGTEKALDTVTITVTENMLKIDGGESSSSIVDRKKNVWLCGPNGYWGCPPGMLGIGSDDYHLIARTFVKVHGGEQGSQYLEDIEVTSTGAHHHMAVDNGRNVWGWGANYWGELGNNWNEQNYGTKTMTMGKARPIQVFTGEQEHSSGYLKDIVSVSVGQNGRHSLALGADGHVWAWGMIGVGQTGTGINWTWEDYLAGKAGLGEPVQVLAGQQDPIFNINSNRTYLKNIVSIDAASFHSVALEKLDPGDSQCNGRVYAFGYGERVGIKDIYYTHEGLCKKTPVMVTGPDRDYDGEDGHGEPDEEYLKNIVAIDAGWAHTMALEKDDPADDQCNGRVYVWGLSRFVSPVGRARVCLGNRLSDDYDRPGEPFGSLIPVMVLSGGQDGDENSKTPLINIKAIATGDSHFMALDENGNVWAWGTNDKGQLGINNESKRIATPVNVVAPDRDGDGYPDDLKKHTEIDGKWEQDDPEVDVDDYLGCDIPIVAIASGSWHSMAMDAAGNVYTWGWNYFGQLGIGSADDKKVLPQPVPMFGNLVRNINTGEIFPTIQAAINDLDTKDGHEIVVYPGTYYEEVKLSDGTNPENDKDIILRSLDPHDPGIVENTVITTNSTSTGTAIITIGNGYDDTLPQHYADNYNRSIISGFTISAPWKHVDGIRILGSHVAPMIRHNIIRGNDNGIVFGDNSQTTTTAHNTLISDNLIYGNQTGIFTNDTSPMVRNTIAIFNQQEGIPEGANPPKPVIRNSIFAENTTDIGLGAASIQYCVVEDGYIPTASACREILEAGRGIFVHTPQFADWTIGNAEALDQAVVFDDSRYTIADVIEVNYDDVRRMITGIDGGTLEFEPACEVITPQHSTIFNWGPGASDLKEDFHLKSTGSAYAQVRDSIDFIGTTRNSIMDDLETPEIEDPCSNYIRVYHENLYSEDDIIEIGMDGVPRVVCKIDGNKIHHEPRIMRLVPSNITVIKWNNDATVVSDITTANSSSKDIIVVDDSGKYQANDLVKVGTEYAVVKKILNATMVQLSWELTSEPTSGTAIEILYLAGNDFHGYAAIALTDVTTFASTNTNELKVHDGGKYTVGDIIEIGSDEVPREITSKSGTNLTFYPELDSAAAADTLIVKWECMKAFYDTIISYTASGSTGTIEVADTDKYHIGDLIKIQYYSEPLEITILCYIEGTDTETEELSVRNIYKSNTDYDDPSAGTPMRVFSLKGKFINPCIDAGGGRNFLQYDRAVDDGGTTSTIKVANADPYIAGESVIEIGSDDVLRMVTDISTGADYDILTFEPELPSGAEPVEGAGLIHWTGASRYGPFATANSSSTEYIILVNGTTTDGHYFGVGDLIQIAGTPDTYHRVIDEIVENSEYRIYVEPELQSAPSSNPEVINWSLSAKNIDSGFDCPVITMNACIAPRFLDVVESGTNNTITVADASKYYCNDIIEIKIEPEPQTNEVVRIPRCITEVDGNVITFAPGIAGGTSVPAGAEIVYWGRVDEIVTQADTTGNEITEFGIGSSYNLFERCLVNDIVRVQNAGSNPEYATITSIDYADQKITIDTAVNISTKDPNIRIRSLWGTQLGYRKDLDGDVRVCGSQIDIGIDEYIPYTLDAGANKTAAVEDVDGQYVATVELFDSEVTLGSGDFSQVSYRWSVVKGPETGAVVFDNANSRFTTATFDTVGIYTLHLEILENGNPVCRDALLVRIMYGVTIESDPEEVTLPETADITAHILGNGPAKDVVWIKPTLAPMEFLGSEESDGPGYKISEDYQGDVSSVTARFGDPGLYPIFVQIRDNETKEVIGEGSIDIPVSDPWVQVEACPDQEILWPENTVTLTGSINGSETVKPAWTIDPSLRGYVHIATPGEMQTEVEFLTPGTFPIYFQALNENFQPVSIAIVIVTVHPPHLIVDAGPDQRLASRYLETYLEGRISEGVCSSCEWVYCGPNPFNETLGRNEILEITNPDRLITHVGFWEKGEHTFALVARAEDPFGVEQIVGVDTVTVKVDFQDKVYVSAGKDQTVALDAIGASADLNGRVVSQEFGYYDSVQWYNLSDETVNFSAGGTSMETTATFTVAGEYELALAALNDGTGEIIAIDTVVITVLDTTRQVAVDAGPDVVITWPASEAALHGRIGVQGIDYDAMEWICSDASVTFGDGVIATAADSDTWANLPGAGVYQITLQVLDDTPNVIGWDTVTVTVLPESSDVDITITSDDADNIISLEEDGGNPSKATIELTGSMDPAGSYTQQWIYTGWNPSNSIVNIDSSATLVTDVEFFKPGVFDISLVVKNSAGTEVVGVKTVTITVLAEDLRTADIGLISNLEEITLPTTDVVTLTASPDVADYTYEWIDPSGHVDIDTTSPNSETTTATFNQAGVYDLSVMVRDDIGAKLGTATVTVTVLPLAYGSFTYKVDAGPDQETTLDENNTATVTLAGTATYGSYDILWINPYKDGDVVVLDDDTSDTPTVTINEPGEYRLSFIVYYYDAATESNVVVTADTVTIIAHPYEPQELFVKIESDPDPAEITYLLDAGIELTGHIHGGQYDRLEWKVASGQEDWVYIIPNNSDATAFAGFEGSGLFSITLKAYRDEYLVGSDTIEMSVDAIDIYLNAMAEGQDTMYCATFSGSDTLNLTAEVLYQEGLEEGQTVADVLDFEWIQLSGPTVTLANVNSIDPVDPATVTITQAGSYTLRLDAYLKGQIGIGPVLKSDIVRIALTDDTPFVEAGKYDVMTTDQVHLDKAFVLLPDGNLMENDNTDYDIRWYKDDNPTAISTGDIEPTITLSDGLYELKLEITEIADPYTAYSDTTLILVEQPAGFVYAGADKTTTVGRPVSLADAIVTPDMEDLIYTWTSDIAGITFYPSANVKRPLATMDAVGTYTLTLGVTILDVDGETEIVPPVFARPGAISSNHVEITVETDTLFTPLVDDVNPEVTLIVAQDGNTVSNGDPVKGKDGTLEIIVEATDKNLDCTYLELDSSVIDPYESELVAGSLECPEHIKLYYSLDLHTLSGGSHTLTAYAWDRFGNSDDDDDSCQFTNDSIICNYRVDPDTIKKTTDRLDFDADLKTGFSGSWTLKLYDPDNTLIYEHTDESGTNPVHRDEKADNYGIYANSPDGTYTAILTATDTTAGEDQANIHFYVAMESVLEAELDSALTETVLEPEGALFDVPDLAKAVIDKGLFDIRGVAWHAAYPEKVRYKIELYDPEIRFWLDTGHVPVYKYVGSDEVVGYRYQYENWGNSDYTEYRIRNITPGLRDAEGYHTGAVARLSQFEGYYDSLGEADFTSLPNGPYALLLTVECEGEFAYDHADIVLDCPLKIGNVKFSQEDLTIPVGGVPLRVVRTYDSLEKDADGEFGCGWTYSFANMDVKLNESRNHYGWPGDSDYYTQRCGSRYDRDVTLTLPDGRRATFRSRYQRNQDKEPPIPMSSMNIRVWDVLYDAPPGVNAELRVKNYNFTYDTSPPELTYHHPEFGGIGGFFWSGYQPTDRYQVDISLQDFPGFVLTTEDGTEYHIERGYYGKRPVELPKDDIWQIAWGTVYEYQAYGAPYLKTIQTISGEKIEFDVDLADKENPKVKGVEHYQYDDGTQTHILTKSIRMAYDDYGRISAIYPPSELDAYGEIINGVSIPYLKYTYDGHGNLIAVEKLADLSDRANPQYDMITYSYQDTYHQPQDHYIVDIADDRGLAPIRYIYDEAGRLIATIDAAGNYIELQHDITGKTETVIDRNKNKTKYIYNERGNVELVIRDPDGPKPQMTQYAYDDENNPDKPTMVSQQVPAPDDWANTYTAYVNYPDEYGDPTGPLQRQVVIDPEDNITDTYFDEAGNVEETVQGRGAVFTPGEILSSLTYTEVSTSHNYYDDRNRLIATEVTENTEILSLSLNYYDNLGRITDSVQVNVEFVTVISQVFVGGDTDNDLLAIDSLPSAAEHVITSYWYDAASNSSGQPFSVSQPYHYGDPDTPVYTTFSHYDYDGKLDYSWSEWDQDGDDVTDRYIISANEFDAQGRTIRSWRIIDDDAKPFDDTGNLLPYSSVVLSETVYNEIGKVQSSEGQHLPWEYGTLTVHEYDELGNVVETRTYDTDWATLLTVSRTLYDDSGRAVVTVGPYDPTDVTTPDYPVGTETVYDALGRVEETRRWANVEIQVEGFDSSGDALPADDPGRVGLRAISWTTDGAAPVVDGELSYSRTEYDVAGRVALSITLDDEGYEQPTGYKYDLAGRQICVADAKDYELDSGDYTAAGNFHVLNANAYDKINVDIETELSNTSSTTYEGTRRKSVTDSNGNTTSFTYDALGRVIKTTHPRSDVEEGSNIETFTHVGYDGLGRKAWQSQQTSAGGSVPNTEKRWFKYDVAGRLIATILPLTNVVDPEDDDYSNGITMIDAYPCYEYVYDQYGNQREIRDNLYIASTTNIDTLQIIDNTVLKYNRTYERTTEFDYDQMGRQTSRKLPDGTSIEYKEYDDEFGRLDISMDFNQQVTEYVYNHLGQLEYKYYYENDGDMDGDNENYDPDGTYLEVVQYLYDNLGRRTDTIKYDSTGTTKLRETKYHYDANGRLIQVDSPEGTINYEYNPVTGQKTRTNTDDGNADTGYAYDELGRLAKVTDQVPDPDTAHTENEYGYNAVGSRQGTLLDNGAYTYYDYDNCNRLKELHNFMEYEEFPQTPQGGTLSSFIYTIYADGMRRSVDEVLEGGTDTRTVTYSYDALNRLEREEAVEDNAGDDGTYGYTADYWHDLVGNRLYRKILVTNNNGTQELHTKYEYDALTDQLETEIHSDQQIAMAIPFGDEPVYAYADGGGKAFYKTASGEKISSFKAFWMGLPSKWGRYTLVGAWSLLALVVLLPVFVRLLSRLSFLRKQESRGKDGYRVRHGMTRKPRFGLFTRTLCLLLAFTFILGPNEFNTLAQADTLYADLDTSDWGTPGDTIQYQYDLNGSLKTKITTGANDEEITYTYNLQNRLSKVETDPDPSSPTNIVDYAEYVYNDAGIKVSSFTYKSTDGGTTKTNKVTILYLIDAANPTGYAQVITELTYNKENPVPGTDVPDATRSYTLGDDVIAQSDNPGTPADTEYLLYDGHGSTRQVSDATIDSSTDILDSYSYDAYGMMLGGNPAAGSNPTTNLLYSGEQFDTNSQNYYNRARYYDPSNGRFNRLDPYAGNNQDPQSLHKYLYCHANPVNGIDPSGESFVGIAITCLAIAVSLASISFLIWRLAYPTSWLQTFHAQTRKAMREGPGKIQEFMDNYNNSVKDEDNPYEGIDLEPLIKKYKSIYPTVTTRECDVALKLLISELKSFVESDSKLKEGISFLPAEVHYRNKDYIIPEDYEPDNILVLMPKNMDKTYAGYENWYGYGTDPKRKNIIYFYPGSHPIKPIEKLYNTVTHADDENNHYFGELIWH